MKKIKPCPFCGENPKVWQKYSDCHIACVNPRCEFQPIGHFDDRESAISVWNTRKEK